MDLDEAPEGAPEEPEPSPGQDVFSSSSSSGGSVRRNFELKLLKEHQIPVCSSRTGPMENMTSMKADLYFCIKII